MMRNRLDAYHRNGKTSGAYQSDSKCKSLCEDTIKFLQKIVAVDDTYTDYNGLLKVFIYRYNLIRLLTNK